MEGTLGDLGNVGIMQYLLMAFFVIEVAKRIASITPGKEDDEIVSKVERFLRKLVDVFAGQHTDRNDPGMIKTKKK